MEKKFAEQTKSMEDDAYLLVICLPSNKHHVCINLPINKRFASII